MIFHSNPTSNFTVLPNETLRDKRLKLTDVGLLAYMLSLPSNWDFSSEGLAAVLPNDGISAISASVKRLESAGYIKRERKRVADGRLTNAVWTVSDSPILENPRLVFPTQDNPSEENHAQTKNRLNKEQTEQRKKKEIFKPPSVEQVRQYAAEQGLTLDAVRFATYYNDNGWTWGKGTPMTDWHTAARYWSMNAIKANSDEAKGDSDARHGRVCADAQGAEQEYTIHIDA